MNPITQGVSNIMKWLGAIPGALASREHVDLLKTRVSIGEQELARAQEKNRELEEQIRQMHQELAAARSTEDFVHERGALFMRRPGGGYHDAVYCPRCRVSAIARVPKARYQCRTCQWVSMIMWGELPAIIQKLTRLDAERGR